MKWVIPLIVVLAGCGQKQNEDNHGLGFEFSSKAASGLEVRYADPISADINDIDKIYQSVASCMNITVDTGPLVIFQPGFRNSQDGNGFFWYDTDTVVMDNLASFLPMGDGWIGIRHEFVHYLLDISGLPEDRNSAHDSRYFTDCVYRSF
jgi:hypothetical protein